jgi:hypothetical protein
MVINKKLVYVLLIAVGVYVGNFLFHVTKPLWHHLAKPSKTICVEEQVTYIPQVYSWSDGKNTHIGTHLVPIFSCEKEAPNPHYAEELRKWQENK